MYSLTAYGRMVADQGRFGPYRRALEKAVTPGCVVVDLGAGPGVLALLAAKLGAAKVYAVDPDPSVGLAAELARANGFGDRVVVVQGLSTRFEPEEPADVVIADLRGVLPLFGRHLEAMADARDRLLTPGGRLIPRRDRLWAVPVAAPDLYAQHLEGFEGGALGLDLEPARRRAAQLFSRVTLDDAAAAAQPAQWGDIDYRTVDGPDVRGEGVWTFGGPSTLHGLAVWFDADLDGEEGFSNAPGAPALIYGQAFFPFLEPLPVTRGTTLRADLSARLVGDDYLWRWTVDLERPEGDRRRLDQSTFHGAPLAAQGLARRSAGHVPPDDGAVEVARFLLSKLDGSTDQGALASALRGAFPGRFPSDSAALTRVAELVSAIGGLDGKDF
ncbi:MAG: 50S ribosomal protein L11 methyltransferase [Acidobacteriota bacterium]